MKLLEEALISDENLVKHVLIMHVCMRLIVFLFWAVCSGSVTL